MKKLKNPIHGWLVIDKPLGLGSTQALGKVKWLLKPEKAGHGGTLDPLATGILPIALGEATKTVNWAMEGVKTYRFTVQWGVETTTDDLEGEVAAQSDLVASQYEIEKVQQKFIGAVQQKPPTYSAIKVSGERAYDLARAGEVVDLAERTVHIESLLIMEHLESNRTTFEVTCGKGTYVRSLARDMGRALGCLGHVVMLRRTRVGPFREDDAISLEKLEELSHRDTSENSLLGILRPLSTVLDGIPALAVMDLDAQRLRQGQSVLIRGALAPVAAEAVLVTHRGQPLGICSIEQGSLKTKRLFNL
jgi:tRNA pseudouridine55 synthase